MADLRPRIPHPGPRPAAPMYDYERGWSLSFVACGFLGFYYIGVTQCLSEHAPHLLRDARMFFGSSAGALHCVAFLSGRPFEEILQEVVHLVEYVRNWNIGIFHPSCNVGRYLRESLHRFLPANIHELISGKVCISLTRMSDWQNVLVSDFQSKDEVVDALVCSSFVPFLFGLIPPTFRGVHYLDGGLTGVLPFDSKTTITVSPFYGECDICPKVKSTNFLFVDVLKLNVCLCSENVHLFMQTLFSLDMKMFAELCLQGYLDAARFLEEKGICDRLHPCPSLSSREPDAFASPRDTVSLEASAGLAAWQTRPVGDELRDHLRLTFLPWDKSILEILSPRFIIALRTISKKQSGYMSKICNFPPVKVMSYVMLPCTLPVEAAVLGVWRLVTWLPDMPDDVRWLQSMTSQICSRLMTHLFPTSRLAGSKAHGGNLKCAL